MLKLMKIFKNYCEKAKSDLKYLEQQQKVYKAFFQQKQLCFQKLDKLLENIFQEKQDKQLQDTIIQKIQVQKVEITELCKELAEYIKNMQFEDWFSKLPEILKQNMQKICNIEKNHYDMLNYQQINLDEIIKI